MVPSEFEFWQGNDIRLHDRLRFRKPLDNETRSPENYVQGENGWIIERLAPLPSKPQSVIIERWLPYTAVKRRVIFQGAPPDPIIVKPRNVNYIFYLTII